jgi:hypothetical protein
MVNVEVIMDLVIHVREMIEVEVLEIMIDKDHHVDVTTMITDRTVGQIDRDMVVIDTVIHGKL